MYKLLMKVFFKENFNFDRLFGMDIKRHKLKAIGFGILLLYALATFLGTFGYLFFDLGKILNQAGMINLLLIYGYIYATTFSIGLVLFRSNGYIFGYKDFQILEALPIKPKNIIAAKITVMFAFIYLGILVTYLPIMFSYFYYSEFNIFSMLFSIIGFIFIPIIPLIIFSFISLLIARFSAKFRISKIINIVLLFMVFFGLMYISFSINTFDDLNPLLNQQGFMTALGKYYPFIKWYVESIDDLNVFSFIKLIIINSILFILYIVMIQKLVVKTNQKSLTIITRFSSKKAKSISRSATEAIIIKEIKKFIDTPIYIFNVGFGPILLFILSIASLFFSSKVNEFISQFNTLGIDFELVILILIAFVISMVYSSAISLSLEGENFWILKSSPIKPKKIMYAKMIFNILLGLPISILALLLFSINLDISVLRLFLMLLVIISISLFVTTLGSVINLYLPKFKFKNPVEVVKQSMSAIITLALTWAVLIADGFGYYYIDKGINFEMGLLFIFIFNIFLAILFIKIINDKAESIFIKFEV